MNTRPIFRAYAHRGGGAEAEENTWESVAHTVNLGYRYMETDIHATADGVLVLQHDYSLARTWGVDANVDELTWAEFKQLRGREGGRPIRLLDVLDTCPKLELNVDAKHDSVVEPFIDFLRSTPARERITVASFSDARLRRIRAAVDVKTSLGPREVAQLVTASFLHLDPRRLGVPGPEHGVVAAQVPICHYRVPIVTRDFIASAHRCGLMVQVWTIDDAETMNELINMGVDGIITDRPSTLKEVVAKRAVAEC